MTYQVLARKWRPQDFAGVVGQQPIVTALRNALKEGRVAQAYLFSGIRGIGRTNVARIFAKALNCERGPAPEPCNECISCKEISTGVSLLDVIEHDAATYSKVEQVRELTESLKYGPARDRYKVIILDEIHRLSRQAFDALLKIVEEPPSHLVFIFATTEIEAVPATILSRCQEFRFRRVPFDELTQHLRSIAEAEGIEVSSTGLRIISRASEGSVRDGVALLDQLATFGSGQIEDSDAARILGGLDHELFHNLLRAILAGRGDEIRTAVREIEEQGWDPRYVFTDFLGYCRNALHLALGAESSQVDLPREEVDSLLHLARDSGYENLLRVIHLLLASEEIVRRSESGTLAVEVAWLRAAELPKLVQIEELLAGTPRQPESEAKSIPEPKAKLTSVSRVEPKPEPASQERAPEAPQEPQAESPSTPPGPSADVTSSVEEFLEQVSRRKQLLAAHLSGAHRLQFIDGELRIEAPAGDTWLRDRLSRESNRSVLEESLASTWGPDVRWRLLEPPDTPEPDRPIDEASPAVEDPRVQAVLDIFGGSVQSIEGKD
jgi:DNA polymerase-3 subunit gamma/tau